MKISDYMSPDPKGVGLEASLLEAEETMRRHQIRHLLVYEGNNLVGIVSERDLLAASYRKKQSLCVLDVMMPAPYVVEMDKSVEEVVAEMAAFKYGSVVIHDSERQIVGIFTSTDALKLFSSLLKQKRL